MSKLDDLINKICPDGVEWKKIGDIADITRGVVMSKDYINEHPGEYPVYSSQTVNNGEIGKIDTYNFEGEYLTWTTDGAYAGAVFYRNGKFSVTNVCGLINIKDKEHISTKYIKYILSINTQSHVTRGMGNAKLMSNVMASIEIPIPPLEIQNEIVRILDNFTELEEELEEKLEEELEARRKQYEYYRDSLLTFDDSVEWKTLGNISTVNRGIRVTRDMLSTEGSIPVYQNALAPLGYFEKSNRKKDTTFVISAGAAGQIGYSGIDFWAADDCFTFDDTNNVLSKYIFYFLQTKQTYIDSRVRRGSIPRISRDVFEKMKIPLPKIEVQKRIVDILDRFESLTTDIKAGLSAEIEARHKQYEYYRDKLLTFKRKSA